MGGIVAFDPGAQVLSFVCQIQLPTLMFVSFVLSRLWRGHTTTILMTLSRTENVYQCHPQIDGWLHKLWVIQNQPVFPRADHLLPVHFVWRRRCFLPGDCRRTGNPSAVHEGGVVALGQLAGTLLVDSHRESTWGFGLIDQLGISVMHSWDP